jgi:hypothetical protein
MAGCATMDPREAVDCVTYGIEGLRPIADGRVDRFIGKVDKDTARCRGGNKAVDRRKLLWVDWQNYWVAGDATTLSPLWTDWFGHIFPNGRGIDGALLDLTYQRMEMLKFNLLDNSGTYEEYVKGRWENDQWIPGPVLKVWPQMRLPRGYRDDEKEVPNPYEAVGAAGQQLCQGKLIRFRTLTGICNDITNPLMGSTNQPFSRNVEFEAVTFLEREQYNQIIANRHGDRLGLLQPDPQLISRMLFTRVRPLSDECRLRVNASCFAPSDTSGYKKANTLNALAAFWIQFMIHDWFSHLTEQYSDQDRPLMPVGCPPDTAAQFGCRPEDRIDPAAFLDETLEPNQSPYFIHNGKRFLKLSQKRSANTVTAWWDASQIYGYDKTSHDRVKRDPNDPSKLLLFRVRPGERQGYLPILQHPTDPAWANQEAVAFPHNWNIGLSFFHNVFAREHNLFVDAFKEEQRMNPDGDSGLRNPANSGHPIAYKDVTNEELFQVARLVVSAEIAKIHTIEWTTQLLYNEPLYQGMNANWGGIFQDEQAASWALRQLLGKLGKSEEEKKQNQLYAAFVAGPGIFGLGNDRCPNDEIFVKNGRGNLENVECINGGTNHFGSPFTFPEEFVSVYRLHAMVPDVLEYRDFDDPNHIRRNIPVSDTFRGKATVWMQGGENDNERGEGLANWALTMGRQRAGKLTLQNHPQFLQNLSPMPKSRTESGMLDVAALDLIRDRERGVPRFNEFRRQYGLKPLKSFDDFIEQQLPMDSPIRHEQERFALLLRHIYGTHECNEQTSPISSAQAISDPENNDCLGQKKGTVDNIEDLDTVVGWLAEPVRPHGFAISETQFQVFILNASRRLFSDRFFTSSFRPEFYSHLGMQWVIQNGPEGEKLEQHYSNGHQVELSPMKQVLLRTIPALKHELRHVVNVFDPWCRDREEYYSLQWKGCT